MKIDLVLKRSLDLEALNQGHHFYINRVFAQFRFREESGWGEERLAIIDTGSPYSVLPFHFWQNLYKRPLFQTKILGIVPHPSAHLKAIFAEIQGAFLDRKSVSRIFSFPALLADSPDIPIILGFAQLLEKVKLVIDYKENVGRMEF